ncbi:MAG: glycine betaine ABC transporter substrate-binding protein [Actinomycetota bacterium]
MTYRATNRRRTPRAIMVVAILAALALLTAACGNGDTGTTGAADGDGPSVNIGWIPWDEDVAVTHLWKYLLEEEGYQVSLTQLDVAPVYQGLADGDVDVFLDGWLPATHADYWERFGDELEDVGVWYDSGTLNLAVPANLDDIQTIGDLQGKADMFEGRIVGIEPGAGLMRVTREEAVPTYGLEDYEVLEGSTPAMLAELERALDRDEPIVVTLWHPHWAYASYDIKDLEDPEGAMGDAENLHVLGRPGFSDDFPELAGWLANFELPDDALASLEQLVINEYSQGEEQQAVEEWLSDPDNRALADGWMS